MLHIPGLFKKSSIDMYWTTSDGTKSHMYVPWTG